MIIARVNNKFTLSSFLPETGRKLLQVFSLPEKKKNLYSVAATKSELKKAFRYEAKSLQDPNRSPVAFASIT